MFSDHNDRKLEINTKNWKINKYIEVQQHTLTSRSNKILKVKSKKYLEMIGNTAYEDLWVAAKAVLRRKIIVLNAYIKKKLSNNPTYQHRN